MEILPTTSWQDLATKADLQQMATQLKAELQTEFSGEFALIRSEMADLRGETANTRMEAATNLRMVLATQLGTFLALFGLIASRL